MAGAAARTTREVEDRLTSAWTTAALSGAASAGKLKPLKHYLGQLRRSANGGRQTPQEILAALRAFQAGGANMTIRKIELKR